ncbi:TonB-dependent receptor [Sulfurimonas sp. HSL3-7]|uniref:TonB-dependent receptor domain-containing protein n=1 Tax=Sulfonitrofixus jiaomeiensis TaxID=3131938 RepID=UPI0031F8A1DE
MKLFLILMAFLSSVYAIDTGELSFYAMKDGKPLADQTVAIFKKSDSALINAPGSYDKRAEFVTDSDGYLFTVLPAGSYQLQVVAKENGVPQAFVKKNFMIEKGKESQLFVSLKADNTLDFVDEEVPQSAASAAQADSNKSVVNGYVNLQLTSSESTEPIKNARIFVKGMKIDVKSDDKGLVSLTIPEGNQTISIIHSEYSSQTVKVTVLGNESVTKFVEMSPASMELEEFVVLAPQVQGSVAAVMAEERNSESIANIIGSEQMSKQGDSNAASALKRVAGVTILGGKYIYVRGLGDRYSSTELNGMALPSPNPVKRTVPLDMFPSGVIGSLQVQKTFTPDITGAFGGGYVNVRTKKVSDDDYAKVKVGLNIHDSYGKEAPSYQGSSSDWTGFDDGYRAFNSGLVNAMTPVVGENPPSLDYSSSEMQNFLKDRNINNQTTTVPLGGEVEMEVAKSFTIADEHELSFLASYGYKSEAKLQTYTSYDYLTSRDGVQESTPDNTAVNDSYRETVQHGGLFNVGYQFRNFDIAYTKLYVLNTLDQTRSVEGTFGENNSRELQSYLEWQERELDINQINGGLSYDLLTDNRFDFGYEFATASEDVPNDVVYNYKKVFASQPYVFQPNQSKLTYNNRTTEDEVTNFFLKNKTDIPLLSDEDYLELGYVQEKKERVGNRRELTIQSSITDADVISGPIGGIIDYGTGDELDYSITSQPKDQYNASLDRKAFYLKGMLKPMEDLDLTFGVRHVDLTQTVRQYEVTNNIVGTTSNELKFTKNLPSLGAKYSINDANQIRLAYSETFVYPDFREFVDAEFIHPVFLAKIAGNPDLVETDIQSVDLRYDYFFNTIDSISASLFYKHMDNPIEDTQTFTTGTLPRYSFENSAAADLAGIELSWYKNLGFITGALDDFVFSGNYTYIDSKVELTPDQQRKFVTQNRGLQGLSPQVLNLSFTYEQSDNRTLNLSYNKMSERLMRVALKNGTVIYALDDYEVPPHLLDFTWTEQFKTDVFADMAMTFKLKNILDDETIWKQGDNVTLKYKTGRSVSLSLSAKF